MADVPEALTPSGRTFKTQIAQVELRNRVLSMIRNGMTASQVSETLATADNPVHLSKEQVQNMVKKYLQSVHMEDARTVEELRTLENERLDSMQRRLALMLQEAQNDGARLKIMDRLLKLSERRARMNGLDAPMKVEAHVGVEMLVEMGLDPDVIKRSEEAFVTAYAGRQEDVIDAHAKDVTDVVAELEAGS